MKIVMYGKEGNKLVDMNIEELASLNVYSYSGLTTVVAQDHKGDQVEDKGLWIREEKEEGKGRK